MKRDKSRTLKFSRETIRALGRLELARGYGTNAAPAGSGAAASDTISGCKSEATGCATYAVGWSCINASCC